MKRWAQDVRDHPELADTATALEQVTATPKGDTATPIDTLRAHTSDPAMVDAVLMDLRAIERTVLERRLQTFDSEDSILHNRVITRVIQDIQSQLDGATDYYGDTRIVFDRILDATIRFVATRHDIEVGLARDRFGYLTNSNALERALQIDYYDYLQSTRLADTVDIEKSHIGGGRSDICFSIGGIRIVAEIKRDKAPVATGALDPYLNQTGLYQNANVALGLLLVLDLSPKPQGQVRHLSKSIWLAWKPSLATSDEPRAIVTALIAGNRPTPSQVR